MRREILIDGLKVVALMAGLYAFAVGMLCL